MAHQLVGHRARLDVARPAHQHRHPERALPVRVLLRPEWRHRAVRPSVHVRSVVARVDEDRVVRDAKVVQGLEERADRLVVLDHAVDVLAVTVLVTTAVLGADVRAQMHARRVVPNEEWFARDVLALHKVDRRSGGLVVDRFHALLGESARVLDGLLADLPESRIDGRIILGCGLGLEHAARAELCPVRRVLRVVRQFRLFLGIEVVEVAEEFVEAVDRGQCLVAIADVILAELAGRVAHVAQEAADRGILLADAHRRAREPNLAQPGADDVLAREKRRTSRGARLFAVVVQEPNAFLGDAIDVGRLVPHQAAAVSADVGDPDVVAEDDEDVGLLLRRLCYPWHTQGCSTDKNCEMQQDSVHFFLPSDFNRQG